MDIKDMIKQMQPYNGKYDISDLEQRIINLLSEYGSSPKNVICMFTYKKEDHLELDLLTSPNKHTPRIIINKV